MYEQFHLASGKTVWLPPDKGEGQHWNEKPGNPFSKPQKIHFDPKSATPIKLTLDQTIPPIEGTPQDPQSLRSSSPPQNGSSSSDSAAKNSAPSGVATCISAPGSCFPTDSTNIPTQSIPSSSIRITSIPASAPRSSQRTPPDPKSPEFRRLQNGYRLFQDWTSGRLPRVILIYVQNANPYYDDSYDVDSANVGPYGSAINDELIPSIEKKYRGIGQGWARATFGGSTGGWEALATQVFYPDSLQRRLCRLSRPRRLPRLPEHQPLRRHQCLRSQRRLWRDPHRRRSQTGRHHHCRNRRRIRL